MKVLLIQPPHADREPGVFPLGIGYIANSLMDAGCKVEVLDIHAHKFTEMKIKEKLRGTHYDLVGINAFSTQYKAVKWLIKELKNIDKNKKIIVGGPLATHNPTLLLENTEADICVVGEGEITIKSIIENIDDLKEVKGIYFKIDGEIRKTAPQQYIRNLDEIGFVPYEIFPVDIYFKYLGLYGGTAKKVINLISSRGCPYNCNFCSRTFEGARFRSIDNIITELKLLKERYSIDGVLFNDELVISSKKRVYELCDKIKALNIEWGCQGRANMVDLDLLKAMKAAGCVYVGYGVESGSQKILDNMNKRVTVEQNEKAIINTLKAGLLPVVQMIFGYPGEDEKTIQETVDFFKKLYYSPPTPQDKEAELSLITPLPGAPLYNDCLKNGMIDNEEEYLLNLERGYNPNCPVLLNFTKFGNEELLSLKKKTEEMIYKNYQKYLRQHPLVFARAVWRGITRYRKRYGYAQIGRKIILRFIHISRGFIGRRSD